MDAPEIHPVHAHATHHRWFDYAIAASALFVSLVSLWVAIHHGRIMERLVQANSLPSITLNSDLVEDPITKALKLTLSLQNSGVGPARIESVELWRDAQPMTRPQDVLSAIKGDSPSTARSVGVSVYVVTGALIGADRSRAFFSFEAPAAEPLKGAMVELVTKLEGRVCYCSVFDECFLYDSRSKSSRAQHVEKCAPPQSPYRDDDLGFLTPKQ